MTPGGFKALCADIRLNWTRESGLVVLLRTPARAGREVRLCVGTMHNDGLVPSNCVAWLGDDLVYEGPLESADLRMTLTKYGLCRACMATAAAMGQPAARLRTHCYANPDTCGSKACPARRGPC